MKRYLFILIIFINYFILVKSINILTKNVYNKNINSMGVDINYALYDITFDEDLYLYKSFGCPLIDPLNKLIEFKSDITNCLCDYKLSNSPVNPCSTSTLCTLKNDNIQLKKEWVSLEIDKSNNIYTINSFEQFRFTNDREWLGFSIEIIPISGSFKAILNGDLVLDSTKDEILFSVCPSDKNFGGGNIDGSFDGIGGTYFLDVYPLALSNVTFSIRLVYINAPEAVQDSTYTINCDSTLTNHSCFDLGSTVTNIFEPTNYYLSIPSSGFYSIQYTSVDNIILLISDDSNNIIPTEENAKYILKNFGNTNNINTLTIYIDKLKSPTIYLRVQCPGISTICKSFELYQPSFSIIKTESQNLIKKKISSMNLFEGSLALASTSRIRLPSSSSSSSYLSCSEFYICNPFSILFPVKEVNPLFPVPNVLQYIPDFNYRYMEVNNNSIQIKEKSYQFALILSVNYGKGKIEYLNYLNASNVEVEFLSIFNLNNNKIELKVTDFNEQPINECNYEEYKNIINQINNGSGVGNGDMATTSIEELNNWKYQLSLFKSKNNWIGCENLVLDYLNLVNVKQNLSSYQCPYESISDPRYQLDACCNYHLSFSQACKEKTVEFQVLKVEDFQNDKILDQCFSKDCTSMVLDQYATQKFILPLENQDYCKVSSYDAINYHLESYNALRKCKKSQLTIPSCNQDSDCQQFSEGTRGCDIFKRKCIANFEILDKRYIGCVLENLPSGTRYSYISTLQINSTIIDTIYNRLKSKDYIIEGSDSKHSTYKYYLYSHGIDQESITRDLIDYSNEIDYKTENQILGWQFEKDDFEKELKNLELINCEAYYEMLPKHYSQQVYDKYNYFQLGCNSDHPEIQSEHSFCGYCKYENSTYCHIYNGSLSHTGSPYIGYSENYPFSISDVKVDETVCNQGISMCLLKDGSYLENVVKEDCEDNKGTCSVPCGYECTGPRSACLWLEITHYETYDSVLDRDQTECEDNGFVYQDGHCFSFDLTEQQCNGLGYNYTWVDCISKDNDNCIGPNWNFREGDEPTIYDMFREMCKLKEIECVSKEQCLNRGGKCSDYNIFYDQVKTDDFYIAYPNGLGKCIKEHSYDTIYGKSCDTDWEVESPFGCYTLLSVPSKEVCQERNGTWWSPSKTKEECESKMACKTLDFIYSNTVQNINPNNLPYATRYNEMNKEDCLTQQNIQPGTEWKSVYSWSNAEWYPGISVQAKWYKDKRFENRYQFSDNVFNYQEFYNEIEEATKKQISVLYSSQTLCQKEMTESYLSSILCSCNSGNGTKECFDSTNRILAQSISCNGDGETKPLLFSNGKIVFQNNSTPFGCEMISVSQISKSTYSVSSPQPLSNNFISYEKPDDYAVLNYKNAIIGTVVSDGVILKSEHGFNQVKLCMTFSSNNSNGNPNKEKYPILDFAILNKQINKLEALGTIAEISVSSNNNSSSSNSNNNDGDDDGGSEIIYYCSIISNLTNNEIIYPINRISNWEDQDKKVLDTKSTVLVYILAILFTLVGTYGLIQTIELLIEKFKSSEPFQLTHLLIASISSFTLIRGVYFFVLPSGSLTDIPASDYVLVVLPTFIYLSSFSIIVALWYIIVFVVLKFNPKAGDMRKRLFSIVSLINTIIYMFFIAIVVIYHYTPFEPNTDCVSLIKEEMKNSNQQIAVSIAYSVVQAFISLFIGLAFIYLGSSIINAMKQNNLGGIYSNNQVKIKILTISCSLSFILHFIFIILISVKAIKSIIFTFVGLIITELIPAALILYYFDQRFIKKSTHSDKQPSIQSNSDKSRSGKSLQLNTVSTESATESSEYNIKK